MSLVRITLSEPSSGYIRRVDQVDTSKQNGYAFLGSFLKGGKELDLAEGTILVTVIKGGSRNYRTQEAIVEQVGREGLKEIKRFNYLTNFLSLRDFVAAELEKEVMRHKPQAAPVPEEGRKKLEALLVRKAELEAELAKVNAEIAFEKRADAFAASAVEDWKVEAP